jgi:hypothetical protein
MKTTFSIKFSNFKNIIRYTLTSFSGKFRKSLLIVIQLTTISAVSCLGFSAIYQTYKNTSIPINGLSSDCIMIDFGHENTKPLYVKDLVNSLMKSDINKVGIYKEYFNTWLGVFQYGVHNPLFDYDQDVLLGSNVAVIDASLSLNIEKENGNDFIDVNNIKHKVLHVMTHEYFDIKYSANYFTSMSVDELLTGAFYFDGVELSKIERAINQISKTPINYSIIYPFQMPVKERIKIMLASQYMVVFSMFLCYLLMLTSFFGIVIAWIQSKAKQIRVHVIVGADKWRVFKFLLKEFIYITFGSFLVGAISSILIYQVGLWNDIMQGINVTGALVSFSVCLVIGVINIFIAFIKVRKQYFVTKRSL